MTNLKALRAALENDPAISKEAFFLIDDIIEDCHDCYGNEYTPRDILDTLEDGEYLAAYFGLSNEDDEEEDRRQIAIVEEAYGFVEQFV